MNLFARIYGFLQRPPPGWRKSPFQRRLMPVKLRPYTPADLPRLLEIYKLNELNRFPADGLRHYEKSLTDGSAYYLVAEKDGRVVASGGMQYYLQSDIAYLCFGLVHPDCQGKGLGTTLLLARLSLLNQTFLRMNVFISAVKSSITFYQRFGFKNTGTWADEYGATHPQGHLILSVSEIRHCGKLLRENGITCPSDSGKIPQVESDGQKIKPE
jgi:ribosomal protein S18 acetylase RimI-like enzyme